MTNPSEFQRPTCTEACRTPADAFQTFFDTPFLPHQRYYLIGALRDHARQVLARYKRREAQK